MAETLNTRRDIDLDALTRWFTSCMPAFSQEEQDVGAEVYRQIVAGKPIPVEQLAKALGTSADEVRRVLDKWSPYDDEGHVSGLWGITLRPTTHRLTVDGSTLYAYCAWDTLFLPELLGKSVEVESQCPETGEPVRLFITPNGIERVEPETAVVSFLTPDLSDLAESFECATTCDEGREVRDRAIASFCHFIFFFRRPEAAVAWTERHPGTFVLSLEDAFELGRRANAAVFKGMRVKRAGS